MIFITRALLVNVGAPDIRVNFADNYPSHPFKRHFDLGMAANVRAQRQVEAARPGRIVNMTPSAVGLVIPGFTLAIRMVVIGLAPGLATHAGGARPDLGCGRRPFPPADV